MKKFFASLACVIAALSTSWGDVITNESFETDGDGTRYYSPYTFTDNNQDYYGRHANADCDRSYTAIDGTYWWGGQDQDDGAGDGIDEKSLYISNINVSGYTDLKFAALWAEERPEASGDDDIDSTDYIHVMYRIDGGSWSNLVWFENDGAANNTTFMIDTNFDGTHDSVAPQLETYFQSVTNDIAGTGSSLDIWIESHLDSGDEDFAVDNIHILGTSGSSATNEVPVLVAIGAQQVTVSNTLTFEVTATDSVDGDTVYLTASNLPSGAAFYPTNSAGSSAGTFIWNGASPTGSYQVTFTASDRNGIDSEVVDITVNGALQMFRMMSANLSSQTGECDSTYQEYAGRIFRGLQPDIAGIQEWTLTNDTYRNYVDKYFGTGFYYHVESESGGCEMYNGIVSRWPIIDSGEWTDVEVGNRDFAWATIRIPADRLLHVVSVHLKAGSTASDLIERTNEATEIVAQINANFSQTNYIAIIGDLNTQSRSEDTLTILQQVVTDAKKPEDQNGWTESNLSRTEEYDYILPNAALNSNHVTVSIGGEDFTEGMVFDSRLWATPPSPILTNDSEGTGLQHMAIVKDYSFEFSELPPVFSSIGDKVVVVSNALNFSVQATPTDGDTVTLTVSNLPSGASFGSTNEVGTFFWDNAQPVGVYTVTFFAVDNDGTEARSMTISVFGPKNLMISEVADPADDYNGRFVELYNAGAGAIDLNTNDWYLSKQTGDTGNWWSEKLTGTVAAGSTYVIAVNTGGFKAAYGFDPDQTSGSISGNGDDPYALFVGGNQDSGALVDILGVINQDGTGTGWEYEDSRAVRKATVTAPSATWNSNEWAIYTEQVEGMTPDLFPNEPPVLVDVGSKAVTESNLLEFTVTAFDPVDDDAYTLTASNLPGSATFNVSNGTGSFSWASAIAGVYTTTFNAADADGYDNEAVVIMVTESYISPAGVVTALINEVRANGTGVDSNEFVEIIAPAGTDMNGCFLVHYNGSSTADGELWRFSFGSFTVPDDGITDTNGTALGFVVIAQSNSVVANTDFHLPGSVQNGPDGLVLYDVSSNILDAVAWEGPGDMMIDDPGGLYTNIDARSETYLHITADDSSTDTCLQAPNNVLGDSGSGWSISNATPGAVNASQVSGEIVIYGGSTPPSGVPPVLAAIGNQVVEHSNDLVFVVTASDPVDGDTITLVASNLPTGSEFVTTNENKTFIWRGAGPTGVYTVTFNASDVDGFDEETITITVTPYILPAPSVVTAFINEVRADGAGVDSNEFVEIIAPAGVNLADCFLVHYNGSSTGDGEEWRYTFGSFVVPDDGLTDTNGVALGFAVLAQDTGLVANADGLLPGDLQNGEDGLVLYDSFSNVIDAVAWQGAGDLADDDPGNLTTNGDARADNYLHVTKDDDSGDGSLQAPNYVLGDDGSGWDTLTATPGTINTSQVSGQIIISGGYEPAADEPPVLGPVYNWVIAVSNALQFSLTAADPVDIDLITMTVSNLPSGATFGTTGGVGTVIWTAPNPAGVYTSTVYASDKDGITSEVFTITVNAVGIKGTASYWVNEFHYDNDGADTNEGVEIAGPAGTDLTNAVVYLYNGYNGLVYSSNALSGTMDDEGCGYGALWFSLPAPQNGPDALALVNSSGELVQFLSYEGAFTANDGPAAGWLSDDVGVAETPATNGYALQLEGTGTAYSAFTWTGPTNHSRGDLNAGQDLCSGSTDADGDGIPDDYELVNWGTTTVADATSDYDGDGMKDRHEWQAGTQPTNINSVLNISLATEISGTGNAITFETVSGKEYHLLRATNVMGPYAGIASNIAALPPANTVTDDAPPALDRVYYRIQLK